jgi:hypothetical protein
VVDAGFARFADQLLGPQQHNAISADDKKLDFWKAFLQWLEHGPAYLGGPLPRQVGTQDADKFTGVVPHGHADVDELHRFARGIGQELCEHDRFVYFAYKGLVLPLHENRSVRDAGTFQQAAG